ncbi:AbrB/MazE/SpoVT family DNA-binding domain-containing protein [Paenibacillus tepidiphilus]|uniref:AbrB/MazE/SpoVT family DNA-binding domain-containing protein n=1 Tax=Paenibacillus tepidiphilus TaxID=2608683 RepID=UPI00123AEC92|nr:AbrB/MazE/SpoVT family DNA-binding domain-containing protein [Paenibacillus tepidiphilus]
MENYSATITSKDQITIPKKVRELLKLSVGDTVSFIIRDNKVIVEKGVLVCPVCVGANENCFVCRGVGKLNPNSSFVEELKNITNLRIPMSIQNTQLAEQMLLPFPIVKLIKNNKISESHLLWYQDYVQAKAIEEYIGKYVDELNIELVSQNFYSPGVKQAIIDNLPDTRNLSKIVLSVGIHRADK